MKKAEQFRAQFMPWAGLVTGLVSASVAHQFGSEGAFNDCAIVSPVPLLVVCILAIAATIVAALASWRVVKNRNEGPSRRLIGAVPVGMAALFVFATLLPMVASLVLPPCFQ